MNVESPARALAVAAVVALLCSAMVSGAVYLLRPLQLDSAQLARNRVVLEAAGRLPTADDSAAVHAAFRELEARVIDLGSGNRISAIDAYAFDHWQAGAEVADDADGAPPPAADAPASSRVPVYLVYEQGELGRVVLPIHGPGMWSTIYGYVALEADLRTVAAIVFLRHGETPGIGDRIEEPQWRAKWRGKQLYTDSGSFALDVVENAQGVHEVDLISGASVTCDAIGDMVQVWFGAQGHYAPFLARLRAAESSS